MCLLLRSCLVLLGGLVLLASASAAPITPRRGYEPARIENQWHTASPIIAGRPAMLITTFHPDPNDPSTVAYLAWIDHRRTALGLYPGLRQPPGASPRGPAEVPYGQRWRLLAAFNSGFKFDSSGGKNGFAVDGHTYVWLKRGLGTLVGYRDGRVDVVSWDGSPTPPRTLPLLGRTWRCSSTVVVLRPASATSLPGEGRSAVVRRSGGPGWA